MALVVGGVAVDLTASAAQISAAMNQAARSVQTASAQMQSNGSRFANSFNAAERRVNASIGRIGSAFRSLQGTLALFGVGLGVRQIIRMADAYQLAGAQLRLISRTAEEAADIQERLFDVAQNLGVGVDALNTIYVRTARNAESLGVSTEGIIQATEALGAAIRISGASATEAQNALIQLSQSFASGVLRGDELRSVAEQMPPVLDAVAAATGKTRQEVINFARENGLAADLVIESLRRSRDAWVAQAAVIGGTVEQAMTRVQNALQRVTGQAGQAGAFQPLIDSLNEFANTLESPRLVSAVAGFAASVVSAADLVLREFSDLAAIVSAVFSGRFSEALNIVQARLRRFGDAASALWREDYIAAVNAAIGRTEALGAAIDQVQIDALYPAAEASAAASRVATQPPQALLELRGAPATGEAAGAAGTAGEIFGPPRPPQIPIRTVREAAAPPTVAGFGLVPTQQDFEEANAGIEGMTASVDEFAAHAVAAATAAAGIATALSQASAGNVVGAAGAVLTSLANITTAAISAAAAYAALQTAQGDFTAVARTVAAGAAVLGALLSTIGAIGAASGRQFGGPVSGGRPYIVGEAGPELFVPSRGGQIVPNNQLGALGGVTVNFDARGSQRGAAQEWRTMIRQPSFRRDLADALAPVIGGDPGLRRAMRQGG